MTSRCPFLARVTVQQLKGARDNVIGNIARKCPVASQQLPASDGDRKMMAPCKTAEGCPFMKSNARQEKEIKQIAMKCCGAAPNLNAHLMIGAAKGDSRKNTVRTPTVSSRKSSAPLMSPANVNSKTRPTSLPFTAQRRARPKLTGPATTISGSPNTRESSIKPSGS